MVAKIVQLVLLELLPSLVEQQDTKVEQLVKDGVPLVPERMFAEPLVVAKGKTVRPVLLVDCKIGEQLTLDKLGLGVRDKLGVLDKLALRAYAWGL